MVQGRQGVELVLGEFGGMLPLVVERAGDKAKEKVIEYFLSQVRNKNTFRNYGRAVWSFFGWCEGRGLKLEGIKPSHVALYIRGMEGGPSKVKVALAAIRGLFDYLVVEQVISFNPASPVKGPKHIVREGKTPIFTRETARQFIESIPLDSIAGIRDRAIVATMLYTFARAGAVTRLEVQDYVHVGKRSFLKLKEKGGKVYSVPVHHTLQEYLDAYITHAGIENHKKSPLFRSITPNKELTARGIHTNDIQRMVKRRAIDAGLSSIFNSHSWRGTGITNYLENGGQLEKAQFIAGHSDSRTTKLYDRRRDDIALDEIERISLS